MTTITAPAFNLDTVLADVTSDYRAADTSGKALFRSTVRDSITAAIGSGDLPLAMHLVEVQRHMIASGPKSMATPIDYVAKARDLRATLLAAVVRIDSLDLILPSGVADLADDTDLTGGTVDTEAVTRLITFTARKSGASRGAVAGWVDAALDSLDVDSAKVSDLRKTGVATDEYGTDAPSSGAIGAMVDRDSSPFTWTTVDGTRHVTRA